MGSIDDIEGKCVEKNREEYIYYYIIYYRAADLKQPEGRRRSGIRLLQFVTFVAVEMYCYTTATLTVTPSNP